MQNGKKKSEIAVGLLVLLGLLDGCWFVAVLLRVLEKKKKKKKKKKKRKKKKRKKKKKKSKKKKKRKEKQKKNGAVNCIDLFSNYSTVQ